MSEDKKLIRQLRLAVAGAERQDDGRKLSLEILDEIQAANLALGRVRGSDVLRAVLVCRRSSADLALDLEKHTYREVNERERRPTNGPTRF